MIRKKNILKNLLWVLLPMFLFPGMVACVKEDPMPFTDSRSKTGGTTLVLDIPGAYAPMTRSMNGASEYAVESADVLVFKTDGGGNSVLESRKEGTNVVNSMADGSSRVEFRAQLAEGSGYDLVIVANAKTAIETLLGSGQIQVGDSKTSVLQKLEITNTGKWAADGSGNYKPIPMLGETGTITISNGKPLSGISMVRMLARIDLKVTTPDFSLQRVHLVNYNTTGRIAPEWNTLTGEISRMAATTPNLGNTGKQVGSALAYDVNGLPAYEGEIYAFEAAAADDASTAARQDATCLVLEGMYQGKNYFYRVDFTCDGTNGSKGDYMPLLRNYKYLLEVVAAEGVGYNSLDEARQSYTVVSNLRVRTIYYDMGTIRDMVFNGQNLLGTNSNSFTFLGAAVTAQNEANKLALYTDNATGWVIEKIADAGGNPVNWITPQYDRAPGGVITPVYLQLAANVGKERTAYIHVAAGRLSQKVKVVQSTYNTPNSYIVAPGGSVDIPVVKAFAVWREWVGSALSESDRLTADVCWQDAPGMISSITLTNGDRGVDCKVRVTAASGKQGNAVVQLKAGGVVCWSWHIWVTDYRPGNGSAASGMDGAYAVPGGNIHRYTSVGTPSAMTAIGPNVFMDRNLGATSAVPGDVKTHGLMYQWGRKDPFIGKDNWVNDRIEPYIYDGSNTAFTITTINNNATPGNGMPNNLGYSLSNPAVFITASSDWYSSSTNGKNDLWGYDGTLSYPKGVYDPCPEGWCVPKYGAWEGLTTEAGEYAFPWAAYGRVGAGYSGPALTGFTYPNIAVPGTKTTVGYYPAVGYRSGSSGEFYTNSVYCYYYTSNINPSNGQTLVPWWRENAITISNPSSRISGIPVRCVVDDFQ